LGYRTSQGPEWGNRPLTYIAARAGEKPVIPSGSTYKIRGGEYSFRGARATPTSKRSPKGKEGLKSKWAQLAAVVGSQKRLRLVAADLGRDKPQIRRGC